MIAYPTATSFIMIPLLCWALRAGNRQKVRALLGVQGLYPASSPGCGKAVVPTRVGRNRNLCKIFTSLRDGKPPAPHRWAAARNCQWCRPLRPKTSESTDCRKKNAKNLIAMYSGPTQFKNNEKHEKTAKLLLFTVFLRGEKQKPLQIPWFLRVRWPKTL